MKKIAVIVFLVTMVMSMTRCKTHDDQNDGNGSFVTIIEVLDGFAGAEGGAIPIVSWIVLDYRNASSKTEKATVIVDWPNDTSSSGEILLPSTGSIIQHSIEIDCDIRCPKAFIFKGEISIPVQVHVEFLGYISPIFDTIITMRNFGF